METPNINCFIQIDTCDLQVKISQNRLIYNNIPLDLIDIRYVNVSCVFLVAEDDPNNSNMNVPTGDVNKN